MSSPYRVTLQGFSPFERSALASYFRLASNRSPAYEQVDTPAEAHFLIVDADHAESVRVVHAAHRLRDAVFIGGNAPAGASAWMMRPIDPLHVLRELDSMVAARAEQRSSLFGPLPSGAGHLGPATIIRHLAPGPAPARRAGDEAGPGFGAAPGLPAQPRALPRGRETLLVDDSEIALRFLETRLQRFGLQTERARTSAKAIELLSQRVFDFVFLDVELGAGSEFDGLALCQHIKRQHRYAGGHAHPVVVITSAHHSELDRVRGTLAGADDYLGKPLDERLLGQLLALHGVTPPAAGDAAEVF